VHVTIGRLLAATLLTVAIGLQILETTGRWDGTLQDTGDEAIIVTVVLCVGAALVAARAARHSISLSVVSLVTAPLARPVRVLLLMSARSSFPTSPPLSLRI
jgi:hypothetical protein